MAQIYNSERYSAAVSHTSLSSVDKLYDDNAVIIGLNVWLVSSFLRGRLLGRIKRLAHPFVRLSVCDPSELYRLRASTWESKIGVSAPEA